MRLSLLSRDVIKEALLFSQLAEILGAGVLCVAESNFRRTHSSSDFRRLINDTGARIIQVQCVADGQILLDRFTARSATVERHPGHCDESNLDEFRDDLLAGRYEPLDVPGEVLTVDTTDPAVVSVDDLATRLSALLNRIPPPIPASTLPSA